MKTILSQLKNLLLVSLLLVFLCGSPMFFAPRPAGADTGENSLAGTIDGFLRSTLESYREKTRTSFTADLKTLQKTVNELSEQLEKVADPRTGEETRQRSLQKITENRQALQEIANSFTALATESEDLDGQLDRAARDLLDLVQGRVHQQLTGSRESLQGMAAAISSLAEDTANVDTEEVKALLARVGGRINALNQAIEAANQAVKAIAG